MGTVAAKAACTGARLRVISSVMRSASPASRSRAVDVGVCPPVTVAASRLVGSWCSVSAFTAAGGRSVGHGCMPLVNGCVAFVCGLPGYAKRIADLRPGCVAGSAVLDGGRDMFAEDGFQLVERGEQL